MADASSFLLQLICIRLLELLPRATVRIQKGFRAHAAHVTLATASLQRTFQFDVQWGTRWNAGRSPKRCRAYHCLQILCFMLRLRSLTTNSGKSPAFAFDAYHGSGSSTAVQEAVCQSRQSHRPHQSSRRKRAEKSGPHHSQPSHGRESWASLVQKGVS